MRNLKGWMMLCLAAAWTLQTSFVPAHRRTRAAHRLVAQKGEGKPDAPRPEGSLRVVGVIPGERPAPTAARNPAPGIRF